MPIQRAAYVTRFPKGVADDRHAVIYARTASEKLIRLVVDAEREEEIETLQYREIILYSTYGSMARYEGRAPTLYAGS